MTAPNLFDHLDRPLVLGPELGKGGEGSVFAVAQSPDLVAKVYHNTIPATHEAKLQAMIGLCEQKVRNVAAWPTATLHRRPGGPVCGLLMRKIKDYKKIHFLYSPAHRKTAFPKADWRFLAHTAMNCAAAFDTVHSAGVVVGDVNQSNVLVSAAGLVAPIDCDSYQIRLNGRTYTCEVGTDVFTPPELQGYPFRGLERTDDHDRFGLAVLIFYLLFMNRHPFAGRYTGRGDMPIYQAIKDGRFAYGRSASAYQMQMPPCAPPLSIVPPQVGSLFEEAFSLPSANRSGRPTPLQWENALKGMLARLRQCAKDSGHVYSTHLSACPWCELQGQGAPNFFIAVSCSRQGAAPGVPFVLAVVWGRIERIPRPSTVYARPSIQSPSIPTPWPGHLGSTIPPEPIPPAVPTSPPIWPGPVGVTPPPPEPQLPEILASPSVWPGPAGLPPIPQKPALPEILLTPPVWEESGDFPPVPPEPIPPDILVDPPVCPGSTVIPSVPPEPVPPPILVTQPVWDGSSRFVPVPPKPVPPPALASQLPLSPVDDDLKQKPEPVVKRGWFQRGLFYIATVCAARIIYVVPQITELRWDVIGAGHGVEFTCMLGFIVSGGWCLVLEWVRRGDEHDLKQQYKHELLKRQATIQRQQAIWKARRAELAVAKLGYEAELKRWQQTVDAIEAEAKRQRDQWERSQSEERLEARERYESELRQWQSAFREADAEARRQKAQWEAELAVKRAEARRQYEDKVREWKKAVAANLTEANRQKKEWGNRSPVSE